MRGVQAYPELVLRGDGGGDRSIVIGTHHLSVGRGADNDLVVPDPQISRHHVILWFAEDQVHLRDLGSANGTFIGDTRVVDTVEVPYGAEIRLGTQVCLTVRPPAHPRTQGDLRAFALEDIETGMRRPLHVDRFLIGTAADADLRLSQGPEQAAVLLVYPSGEVWLGTDDDDDRQLEIGGDFEVSGVRFRVLEADPTRQPTVQPDHHRYPYHLSVSLNGPAGAVAELSGAPSGKTCQVLAENRVVLLYLLARKLLEDRQAGIAPPDCGWCNDQDVIVGVWGRGALDAGGNRLKVLVHRVRKELKAAGFEPWCIEKRSGFIRGRFVEVLAT